jgi:hypothetical protein
LRASPKSVAWEPTKRSYLLKISSLVNFWSPSVSDSKTYSGKRKQTITSFNMWWWLKMLRILNTKYKLVLQSYLFYFLYLQRQLKLEVKSSI